MMLINLAAIIDSENIQRRELKVAKIVQCEELCYCLPHLPQPLSAFVDSVAVERSYIVRLRGYRTT